MSVKVIARCVACGHKRAISPGEVPRGEMPTCDKCFSVMVAESAAGDSNSKPQPKDDA